MEIFQKFEQNGIFHRKFDLNRKYMKILTKIKIFQKFD